MTWPVVISACFLAILPLCLGAQSSQRLQYHPDLLGNQTHVLRPAGLLAFNTSVLKNNLSETPLPTLAEMRWQAIAFQVDDLPVFCRMELKMEKAVNFPVKFRLGEVQYVERMEGKH